MQFGPGRCGHRLTPAPEIKACRAGFRAVRRSEEPRDQEQRGYRADSLLPPLGEDAHRDERAGDREELPRDHRRRSLRQMSWP